MIYPEREAGERTAHLVSGRMLDFIEFDDDFALVKMYPPEPIRGKNLTESGVRSKHNVTVVGVKSPGKPFTYATEQTVGSNHDLIIVSGTEGDIEKFADARVDRERPRQGHPTWRNRLRVREALGRFTKL